MSSQVKKYEPYLLTLFSFSFVFFLFGKNLLADFWLIDDHSILTFINNANNGFLDFFKLVAMSEVGQFGTSNRFRPGYYTLYVLETLIWGANPFFWYLFRIFMCSVFVLCITKVVSRNLGIIWAILFILLTFSYTYWTDIWSRLGPGESYCAFGLGIFVYAYFNLIQQSSKNEIFDSVLLFIGTFIAAGSKENFLILFLPLLILLYFRWKKSTLSKSLNISIISSLLYIGVIILNLFLAFRKTDIDFYANPVTFESRLLKLLAVFQITDFLILAITFILFLSIYFFRNKFSPLIKFLNLIYLNLIVSFFGAALILIQVVFYNGKWPTDMRYDFPGMMVLPLVVVIWGYSLAVVFSNYPKFKYFIIFIILGFNTNRIVTSFKSMREGAKANVERTQTVKKNIDLILQAGRDNPKAGIVFESFNPLDYESIISLKVFLGFYKLMNPIVVRVHNHNPENQETALYKMLSSAIISWEKDDQEKLKNMDSCFSVYFNGKATTNCSELVRF